MDFVYDKPIFTQWTFAPAEPSCRKGKTGADCRSQESTKNIIKHIIKHSKKIMKYLQTLKNADQKPYDKLSTTEKVKFMNLTVHNVYIALSASQTSINSQEILRALQGHKENHDVPVKEHKDKNHKHHHR